MGLGWGVGVGVGVGVGLGLLRLLSHPALSRLADDVDTAAAVAVQAASPAEVALHARLLSWGAGWGWGSGSGSGSGSGWGWG